MLKIKRVYETPDKDDGIRVMVDRLWPRGLSKEKAKIDKWMKEVAPSDSLRKWFGHQKERWEEFKVRYFEELKGKKSFLEELEMLSKNKTVTLLYAAKDKDMNNAQALFKFIKRK